MWAHICLEMSFSYINNICTEQKNHFHDDDDDDCEKEREAHNCSCAWAISVTYAANENLCCSIRIAREKSNARGEFIGLKSLRYCRSPQILTAAERKFLNLLTLFLLSRHDPILSRAYILSFHLETPQMLWLLIVENKIYERWQHAMWVCVCVCVFHTTQHKFMLTHALHANIKTRIVRWHFKNYLFLFCSINISEEEEREMWRTWLDVKREKEMYKINNRLE